jgi:hypothetical protein
VQSKGDGAQQLGSLDEHGRSHVEHLGRNLHRVAPDRFPHRLEQDVAGPAEQTADDHPLRVHEIAKACDGYADLATRIGDCSMASQVSRDRALDDPRQRRNLSIHRTYQLDDRRA